MNLLEVKNLTVSYLIKDKAVPAVRDVSLSLKANSVLALVGESGSGKSTCALSVGGLLAENAVIEKGCIDFKGVNLLKLSKEELTGLRGRKIGYVFQDPVSALNPVMSVGEQLCETLAGFSNISARQAAKRAVELLSLMSIPDPERILKFYPHQLSGGMNQRVLIAIALSGDPELLIADEPTSNLDATIEASIMWLLKQLKEKLKISILFITHDLSLVRFLADEAAVIKEGRVIEKQPVDKLFLSPENEYTRILFNASRLLSEA